MFGKQDELRMALSKKNYYQKIIILFLWQASCFHEIST